VIVEIHYDNPEQIKGKKYLFNTRFLFDLTKNREKERRSKGNKKGWKKVVARLSLFIPAKASNL
jgi:hypothetical protein